MENESTNAIDWFRGNDMIVNPEKFQAIIFNRRPKDENTYTLNFLSKQSNFLNHDAMRIVIKSFVLANFNYCPLVWHFCSCESINKLEKIQDREPSGYF